MKKLGLIAAVAFMAGLSLASLAKQVPVAPSADAQTQTPVKPANGALEGQYVTQSADGLTLVVWYFESQGKNTADYGPTLKWAKVYHAGQQ